MNNIAIFASGAGSNADNIINHFADSTLAKVELILSNKPDAKVLERAKISGVESVVFDRDTFYNSDKIVDLLVKRDIDYVVLAGFLWLIPTNLIERYRGRLLNIHPALLPSYGGKGMYGDRVHQAVVDAGETKTGITIHQVNEMYDSGDIVAQFCVDLTSNDTPQSVAKKVHQLEYAHFPTVIENEIKKLKI